MDIVDTHQHLWDLGKFKLPWLEDVGGLRKDHLMSDYLAAAEGTGITRTIYMEVDVKPSQRRAEAKYVGEMCAADDNPMEAAVLSGSPGESGFRDYVAKLAKRPFVKGIRQVLHVPERPAGYCLGADFVSDVRYLGELGLRFDLCMRPSELLAASRLAAVCPDTQFVLDHCGNADPLVVAGKRKAAPDEPFGHTPAKWKDGLASIASQDNVICKISGIVARAGDGWTAEDLAPTINHCINSFGVGRVMFGSDWPVCTLQASLEQWMSALKEVISERSEENQAALLGGNAIRFYGLQ